MKKKKIHLILTVKNHEEFYNNLITDLIRKFEIVVYCYDDLNLDEDLPFIARKFKRITDQIFINQILKIHSNTTFIIEELYGNWFRISKELIKKNKVFLIVHNCRKFERLDFSNPLRLINSIKRKSIITSLQGILTVSPVTKKYLEEAKISTGKSIFLYPFKKRSVFDEKPLSNPIKIGVVGSLSGYRKDLKYLERILNHIKSHSNLKDVLKIYHIGIRNDFFATKYELKGYDAYLSQKKLNKLIASCDFILSLTKKEIKKHGVREYYGYSKETGISFDAYSNSKPLISNHLPKNYWYNEASIEIKDQKELLMKIEKFNYKKITNFLNAIDKKFESEINILISYLASI